MGIDVRLYIIRLTPGILAMYSRRLRPHGDERTEQEGSSVLHRPIVRLPAHRNADLGQCAQPFILGPMLRRQIVGAQAHGSPERKTDCARRAAHLSERADRLLDLIGRGADRRAGIAARRWHETPMVDQGL